MGQSGEERRRHARFPCDGKAEMRSLGSGFRAAGEIENLSLSGCLMRLRDRYWFREGEEVEMTFCVRQLPFRVGGRVREIHPGKGVGVEFTLLTERGRGQLLVLIDELDEIVRGRVDALERHPTRGDTRGAEEDEGGKGER
jgi:PilZ domain